MKRSRKVVPIKTKYEILKAIEAGEKRMALSQKYGVAVNTISDWWKRKDRIYNDYLSGEVSTSKMKKRICKYERVDKALFTYFEQSRAQNVPLSGPLLREKADQYAKSMHGNEASISLSWFERWKVRHGVVCKKVSGEDKAVDAVVVSSWQETTLPTLLSKYSLKDIYNADEFGLFFAALPNVSLHLKGQRCSGGKFSKNRITGLVCSNAEGDKMPLLIIGKSKVPRCFKHVKSLPCTYRNQTKAWMNSDIFEAWVKTIDAKMKSAKRKILLLVDNCRAHPIISDLEAVELVFLPKNTTAKLQPMDMGVIRSLKAYYRTLLVRKVLECLDAGNSAPKISVLDAMFMATSAWKSVTSQTIINCFRKAGISNASRISAVNDADDPFAALSDSLVALGEHGSELMPQDSTIDGFIDFDANVEVTHTEVMTDAEILQSVSDSIEVEDEEGDGDIADLVCEPTTPVKPSKSDISAAFQTLERLSMFFDEGEKDTFLQNINNARSVYECDLLKQRVQLTIDNFFKAPEV